MKIIFWGTPKYAADNLVNIVKDGYQVLAVVTQPDRKRSRGKQLCPSPVKAAAIDLDIPVFETASIKKDTDTRKLLSKINADVYLVVAFGQILPREILEQPKLGCWNSHASLLPTWRGAAPIQWSIMNDDTKTGVCIMAMEEGLDTGQVIESQSININETDNLEILTNKLSKISSELLIKSLKNIQLTEGLSKSERLSKLNAIDQSSLTGNISYARQITKNDFIINWNKSSRTIYKKIKGLYPNVYTLYAGKRIKIRDVRILGPSELNNIYLEVNYKSSTRYSPGQVIIISKQCGILIMTNDNPIYLLYGQLEGKKATDGYTLSNQSNLTINSILGS